MAKKKAAQAAQPTTPIDRAKKVVSEKTTEANFVKWCKEQGWRCPKLQDVGQEGHPDRTVRFGNGRQVYVELKKAKTGKLRATQVNYIKDLTDIGERVLITDNLEEAKAWVTNQYLELVHGIIPHTDTRAPQQGLS